MATPCKLCIHSVQYPHGTGLRCRKFKRIDLVETSIARYDGYDLCGKQGKYFTLCLEKQVKQAEQDHIPQKYITESTWQNSDSFDK